ncbi:hypothetical protein A4V12_06410 [Streptomyces noursei]|nr:hypothetical protein A4V12_06410 [Streptomyces noursei]
MAVECTMCCTPRATEGMSAVIAATGCSAAIITTLNAKITMSATTVMITLPCFIRVLSLLRCCLSGRPAAFADAM